MSEKSTKDKGYIPPEMLTLDVSDIMEKLGPVMNCSGYGGAASGCD